MKHRILSMSALITLLLFSPFELGASEEWQFERLATGGFGDSANICNLAGSRQGARVSMILDYIINEYGGADLWRTKDGIRWEPVTLSGFENPLNYGIRRIVPIPDEHGRDRLVIGTANPFTGLPNGGCEVLATKTPPIYVNKFWFWLHWLMR